MKIALSIAATFLLLLPATFVGGIARFIYIAFVGYIFEGGLLNWVSNGIFGAFALAVFPNILHGVIAGGLAVFVGTKIVRGTSFEIASYAVSAMIVLMSLLGGILGLAQDGFGLDTLALISNTAGIVIGLFMMSRHIDQELAASAVKTTERGSGD